MKKVAILLTLFISSLSVTFAQEFIVDKDNEIVTKTVTKLLKDEFKFSENQADSVVFFQQQFQIQTKEILENLAMTEKEQKDFVKEKHQLYKSKMARIVAEDKLDIVEEFYKKNIKELREKYKN